MPDTSDYHTGLSNEQNLDLIVSYKVDVSQLYIRPLTRVTSVHPHYKKEV